MHLLDRLRRPDWLAEMQSALVLTLLVAAGIGVLGMIDLAGSGPLEVSVVNKDLVHGTAVPGLEAGVHAQDGGRLDVVVTDPTPAQVALSAVGPLTSYLVVVFVMIMLLQVVRAARRDDPFSASNVRRLRLTGVVVLVGGPLAVMAELLATLALSDTATTGPPAGVIELTWWWLPVGFGFLAIAEVINRGRVIRAELADVI